ncbi:hypothetical protein EVAR_54946_1 [Eumeta japonica]|uniref:Uncharacterized protein n=1 Tax=Eumeta variegata TaxID=151549 RepID=A0A4C1YM61_EUMVA|nr:hypothetical protein EVAR_54946_1 [Eumeta japonica]
MNERKKFIFIETTLPTTNFPHSSDNSYRKSGGSLALVTNLHYPRALTRLRTWTAYNSGEARAARGTAEPIHQENVIESAKLIRSGDWKIRDSYLLLYKVEFY